MRPMHMRSVGFVILLTTIAQAASAQGIQSLPWTNIPAYPYTEIYVSSQSGNDNFTGNGHSSALKTIKKAIDVMRSANPRPIFKIMLHCGETFDLANENTPGSLIQKPFFHFDFDNAGTQAAPDIITSYVYPPGGVTARPIINTLGMQSSPGPSTPTDYAFNIPDNTAFLTSHLWVIGLQFESGETQPPGPTGPWPTPPHDHHLHGFFMLNDGDDLLLEDCWFGRYGNGFTIQRLSGAPTITNFRVRRCVFWECGYFTSTTNLTGQGCYVHNTTNTLIEECVFDKAGWADGVTPTEYRHAIYVSDLNNGAVMKGNIIATSPDAVQWRSGGIAENNLILDSGIGFSCVSDPDPNSIVRGNVILHAKDMDPSVPNRRGWGLSLGEMEDSTSIVERNVVAHSAGTTNRMAIGMRGTTFDPMNPWGPFGATVRNNRFYNAGPALWSGTNFPSLLPFSDNKLHDDFLPGTTPGPMLKCPTNLQVSMQSANNTVYADPLQWAPSQVAQWWNHHTSQYEWMLVDDLSPGMAPWCWRDVVGVGDTTSRNQQSVYPLGPWTIGEYYQDGAPHAGTWEQQTRDLMAQAVLQGKTFWRDKYCGTTACSVIRTQYGL